MNYELLLLETSAATMGDVLVYDAKSDRPQQQKIERKIFLDSGLLDLED